MMKQYIKFWPFTEYKVKPLLHLKVKMYPVGC